MIANEKVDEEQFFEDVVEPLNVAMIQVTNSTEDGPSGKKEKIQTEKYPNGFQLEFAESYVNLDGDEQAPKKKPAVDKANI